MSAKASWSRTTPSSKPPSSASTTPMPAPGAAHTRPGAPGGRRRRVPRRLRRRHPRTVPRLPPARADAIAYHAALRGSGRVGRSAAGRALDPDAIRLAVAASVRHVDTDYDDLLMSGVDRDDARHRVRDRVDHILDTWRDGATVLDA